jgi:hypothetical protein
VLPGEGARDGQAQPRAARLAGHARLEHLVRQGWLDARAAIEDTDAQVLVCLLDGETGAVTAIQRANSDLLLSPHFHTLFLDGVYGPDVDGKGQMFYPAPAPRQEEVEQLVGKVSKRILQFLQRRGVITLVTAPARTQRGVGRCRGGFRSPRRGATAKSPS